MPWTFFPTPETVFADDSARFFVPLASIDLNDLRPCATGAVHWLRPLYDGNGEPPHHDSPDWPQGWFPFRRGADGRFSSLLSLTGAVRPEANPFEHRYLGDIRAQVRSGTMTADDLLDTAHIPALGVNASPDGSLSPEDWPAGWPNANWTAMPEVLTDTTRRLAYLGALDTTSFGPGDCETVLLCDEPRELFVIVLDWS